MEERNQAGEKFLELCVIKQLTILNTWFTKKLKHLGTWMHSATRTMYMIDYVVAMLDSQQRLCTDVQVMRGANCWTDHQMVRAKV